MKSTFLSASPVYGVKPKRFLALHRLLMAILQRSTNVTAEVYLGETLVLRTAQRRSWHWRTLLTLIHGLVLLCIAILFVASRQGYGGFDVVFVIAMGVIFALPAWRLLHPTLVRSEQIYLLCLVGMTCYLVKVLCSPLGFAYYDEFPPLAYGG